MIGMMLVTAVVDLLLLMAVGRLLGSPMKWKRVLAGGLISGLFAMAAAWWGILLRIAGLGMGVIIAFGLHRDTGLKALVFTALHVLVSAITKGHWYTVFFGAAGILFLCILSAGEGNLIPVELSYMGKTLHITALRDTGNQLRDPITGRQVLIVGADIAAKLTGLTPAALGEPVENIGAVPGLRLIPYRTIGNTGFLLALKLTEVKVGARQENAVVAFSPQVLGNQYQALAGGMA